MNLVITSTVWKSVIRAAGCASLSNPTQQVQDTRSVTASWLVRVYDWMAISPVTFSSFTFTRSSSLLQQVSAVFCLTATPQKHKLDFATPSLWTRPKSRHSTSVSHYLHHTWWLSNAALTTRTKPNYDPFLAEQSRTPPYVPKYSKVSHLRNTQPLEKTPTAISSS